VSRDMQVKRKGKLGGNSEKTRTRVGAFGEELVQGKESSDGNEKGSIHKKKKARESLIRGKGKLGARHKILEDGKMNAFNKTPNLKEGGRGPRETFLSLSRAEDINEEYRGGGLSVLASETRESLLTQE